MIDDDLDPELELDDPGAVTPPHFRETLWHELAVLHPESCGGAVRRRGRSSLRLGVGLAVAAALVVVGLASRPSTDAPRGSPGAGPVADGAAPEMVLPLETVAAIEQATAESVVHVVRENAAGPDEETWSDQTTGAFRRHQSGTDGEPAHEVGGPLRPAASGEVTVRSIDHCARTVTDVVWPALDVGGETNWVADGLRDGWLVADGTETVDGRELQRLRIRPDGGTATPVSVEGPPPTGTVLIDPETHLPVSATRDPGTGHDSVETYEYLPRTDENLALVAPPPVPEGYTQVDPPPTDAPQPEPACGL